MEPPDLRLARASARPRTEATERRVSQAPIRAVRVRNGRKSVTAARGCPAGRRRSRRKSKSGSAPASAFPACLGPPRRRMRAERAPEGEAADAGDGRMVGQECFERAARGGGIRAKPCWPLPKIRVASAIFARPARSAGPSRALARRTTELHPARLHLPAGTAASKKAASIRSHGPGFTSVGPESTAEMARSPLCAPARSRPRGGWPPCAGLKRLALVSPLREVQNHPGSTPDLQFLRCRLVLRGGRRRPHSCFLFG